MHSTYILYLYFTLYMTCTYIVVLNFCNLYLESGFASHLLQEFSEKLREKNECDANTELYE